MNRRAFFKAIAAFAGTALVPAVILPGGRIEALEASILTDLTIRGDDGFYLVWSSHALAAITVIPGDLLRVTWKGSRVTVTRGASDKPLLNFRIPGRIKDVVIGGFRRAHDCTGGERFYQVLT